MNSGLRQGILQGIKTGISSSLKSGMLSGMTSKGSIKDKMQDPALIVGGKKPLLFCNADNLDTNSGTVITLKDLVGSGYRLTNAQGTSFTPDLVREGIFNLRDYLDFNNSNCSLYPTPEINFNGKSEISFIMVLKLKSIASQIVFLEDSTTPGGIDLSIIDANRTLRSIYYGGQPGSVTNSQYDTFLSPNEREDWIILTCKYRLKQNGAGSEQEMYVNGRFQHKFNSSNFNIVTTSYTSAQQITIGNTSRTTGSRGASMLFGSFLLFDYWLNESEQLRLENYFRWYYGNKF